MKIFSHVSYENRLRLLDVGMKRLSSSCRLLTNNLFQPRPTNQHVEAAPPAEGVGSTGELWVRGAPLTMFIYPASSWSHDQLQPAGSTVLHHTHLVQVCEGDDITADVIIPYICGWLKGKTVVHWGFYSCQRDKPLHQHWNIVSKHLVTCCDRWVWISWCLEMCRVPGRGRGRWAATSDWRVLTT